MKLETYLAFKEELEKISAVFSMPSHYEVTLDENGKATGLSDTVQMLAHLPGGLKTVRTQADEDLEKLAWHGAAEVAGLGILAAPTIQKMRGKEMSERKSHAAELGGLGVLAAPAAHTMIEQGRKAFKPGSGARGVAKAVWHGITKHNSVQGSALSLFSKEAMGALPPGSAKGTVKAVGRFASGLAHDAASGHVPTTVVRQAAPSAEKVKSLAEAGKRMNLGAVNHTRPGFKPSFWERLTG